MVKIQSNENDDQTFLGLVEKILRVEVSLAQPEDVFITKVDHWFDFKWRGFSHKIFGALGVWHEEFLRIPPFIPDRIVQEIYFQKIGEIYEQKEPYRLHTYQNSDENAPRKINGKSAIYCWFSSETVNNSQGSLMVYKFGKDFQNSWYASFMKKAEWQIYKTDNISKSVIKSMIKNDYLALIR